MFGCKVCTPADPVSDTVRFDAGALARAQADEVGEEDRRREEAQEAQEAECAKEQRRAEVEADARRRFEAERLRAEEEAEQRAAAEAFRLAEEAERREAAERAAAEARQRKAEVAAFLKQNGYTSGVAGPKRCMTKTKYPLHTAAKQGSAAMVVMLLQEGADAAQVDSSGKTAALIAQKEDRNNSHVQVLRALAAAPALRRAAGGA